MKAYGQSGEHTPMGAYLSRRSFLRTASLATTGGILGGLVGCGGSSSGGSAASDAGELNLFIWTEYVPESVLQSFQDETGITVNVSYYSTNEDLYAKLRSETEGTYDIVQPSDYMVAKLIAQDMLEPLDTGRLENFSNIGSSYLGMSYDPDNAYSVPYMVAMAGLAYNSSMVDKPIEGYADLFDPAYENSILVLDDARCVIGITNLVLGHDPSTTDPDELAAAADKLMTMKKNVKIFDSDNAKASLISGDCAIAYNWNAELVLASREVPDIEYVYPSEGAIINEDNWCIAKGAANYDNAMKFIDYILRPEVSAACSEELPYVNPNMAALDILGSEYTDNEALNPTPDQMASCVYIDNLSVDAQASYEEIWTSFKK